MGGRLLLVDDVAHLDDGAGRCFGLGDARRRRPLRSGEVAGVTSATVAFTVADGVSGDWTAVLSANLAGARVDPVGALECNLGVGPSARCSKRRALVEFAISDLATAGSSNSDGGGSLCGPAGLWATSICPSGGDWAGDLSGTGVFLAHCRFLRGRRGEGIADGEPVKTVRPVKGSADDQRAPKYPRGKRLSSILLAHARSSLNSPGNYKRPKCNTILYLGPREIGRV